ncbi:unnamed protein product [Rhizophagus irregularis]|nr:unnamed protein product [Rhizophagus irregularis]
MRSNCNYKLARQLACAVLCLHDEGILHNDLNSANILVHQHDIKLSDFGLSKRINESSKLSKVFGLYTECWDGEPYNRPTTREIVTRLKDIISGNSPSTLKEIPIISLSTPDSSQHGNLSKLIEDLHKMNTRDLDRLDTSTTRSLSIYYSIPEMKMSETFSQIIRPNNEVTEKDLSTNVDEIDILILLEP